MTKTSLWLYRLFFLLAFAGAAWFRLMGLDWDQGQHLHPDERFLTMVSSALEPVNNLGEYFDTANSPLNPHNRGYGFYVYGTLPVFIVRHVAEWMSQIAIAASDYALKNPQGVFLPLANWLGQVTTWAGYSEITLVGRFLAAVSDLASIGLLYLIARRLYDRRVASLAAAFAGFSVMLIQQAHFYTVDSYANFFIFLATYFAVEVLEAEENAPLFFDSPTNPLQSVLNSRLFWNSALFGVALGMAVASKINAAPLALLLPGALILRYLRLRRAAEEAPQEENAPRPPSAEFYMGLLILGAVFSLLAFRIFQPYAFQGEFGFLDLRPNPQWVQNLSDQRAQASGDVDFPPALQWARRPVWFSGYNLTVWGLGLPLGLLAWAGFLLMGWRILRGDGQKHLLLWGWAAFYFLWQSSQWNPTMRYQLPIYPLLALFAAWLVFYAPRPPKILFLRYLYPALGVFVLLASLGWSYAFSRIYTRDHSRVQATQWIYQNVPGPYNLSFQRADGSFYAQPMSLPYGTVFVPGSPYNTQFNAAASGILRQITLGHAADPTRAGTHTIPVYLGAEPGFADADALATASLTADFSPTQSDLRGTYYTLTLEPAPVLEENRTYYLRFVSGGILALSGAAPIHETSWDDGLPLRMGGYDAYGGMYQGDLNFEMYWDDNQEKLNLFLTNLQSGDYIFITSNRQWATTTRIPERYPLTVTYYRALLGCPPEKDVIWCYNVAEPGMFTGSLGFELVQTFTSYPEIFGWQVNTQFAEEAFTVYDAPKVLLFKKTADYSPEKASAILGAVDLSRVVHITPRQASRYPGDLTLPADRLAAQQAGGTWSNLFSYQALQNAQPFVGLLLWYLALSALGFFTFPLLRHLLPGLPDAGYPLARLTGLLLLAYFAWLAGSFGLEYSRGLIWTGYGLILLAGAAAFWAQRKDLAAFFRQKGKYLLLVEALFLLLFAIDFGIRLANPDLWHPARGGERPMDFSYLNAVLKSTSFPPYDPWYAGGYINYYYWGFVLVGTPIKMLGIVPAIAYNFVLPTLFALLGVGGFSVAWNLLANPQKESPLFSRPLWGGLAASAGLVLVGNLGTVRLVFHALQKMMVPNELFEGAEVWFFERWLWAAQGIGKLLSFSGHTLPVGWGEWYWAPSRVMPTGDLAITEFPLFTFLYSDLHAHMIAMPLTVLAVAWAVSALLVRNLSGWRWLLTLAFGGLVVGALRPTNTWDFPTYLALTALVAGYAIFRYAPVTQPRLGLSPLLQRFALAAAGMGILVGFALLFYQPFARWYGLDYSKMDLWENEKTPIWSYFSHWGLFLFIIFSWMSWETRQWMAQTPVSALSKLQPYRHGIEAALGLLVSLTLLLQFVFKVEIAWLALPMAAWALLLMLRPAQPDSKRLALFMIGTGLVLTLLVEVIVLVGDIGRMNTVFKFYLQAWILFALASAAAFGWILTELDEWTALWRGFWQTALTLLFAAAAIYLFTAGMDKIRDRMANNVPFTLNSMDYMYYSTFWDREDMTLNEDYLAIRWMQENIPGSPVIIEANTPEYRWGSRFTIYTGLPGVVGWNWHQRQQRALFPSNWVTDRVEDVASFYSAPFAADARRILQKYNVSYIIVGQLERIYYPEGIAKFEENNGIYWQKIYTDGKTAIYQALP